MKRKKILFNKTSENIHTLWKELVLAPPEGYEFIVQKSNLGFDKLDFLKKNKIIKYIYRRLLRKFINPIQLVEMSVSVPEGIDLIYSPDMLIKKDFPWVCDIEEAICFGGGDMKLLGKRRREIERILASKWCKKIMAFTEFGKETIEREFDTSLFKDKIEVVRFATEIPNLKHRKDSKEIVIIFVGTANQTDPKIFNLKGGREAIEAFRIISKKYDNVKLKVFSNVPKNIDTNIRGLEIVPLMDREKLLTFYAKSDIFLAPSYFGLGMTIVEALGSGLPMVCTDMFGMPEAIDEGKNGLKMELKNKGKYKFNGPSISEFGEFGDFIYKNNGEDLINQIVEKLSILIENPKLRVKMGRNSRKKYEKEFSIEVRNKKLKRIFDEITRN